MFAFIFSSGVFQKDFLIFLEYSNPKKVLKQELDCPVELETADNQRTFGRNQKMYLIMKLRR